MTLLTCGGKVLASGIGSAFDDGEVQVMDNVCLEEGLNGLALNVGGGLFPEDVSWSLTFPSGIVEKGGAGYWSSEACYPPSPQPSNTFSPTRACALYVVETYDSFGDG